MEMILLKAISGLFDGIDGFCKGYNGHIFMAILCGIWIIHKFTTKIAVKHTEYDVKFKDIEKDVSENKEDTKAATAAVAEIKTDVTCIKKDVTDIKTQIGLKLDEKFKRDNERKANAGW